MPSGDENQAWFTVTTDAGAPELVVADEGIVTQRLPGVGGQGFVKVGDRWLFEGWDEKGEHELWAVDSTKTGAPQCGCSASEMPLALGALVVALLRQRRRMKGRCV